jgi:hypothetical protein
VAEYDNVALLPGEQVAYAADFTPHRLRPDIKSGFVVTKDRIVVRHPQHIFLFIPAGYVETSTPLGAVAAVSTGSHLSEQRVMAGSICVLVGIAALTSGLAAGGGFMAAIAVVLLGVAAYLFWSARTLGMTVRNVGGSHVAVQVDGEERSTILAAATAVQQQVSAWSRPSPPPAAATAPATRAPSLPPRPQTPAPHDSGPLSLQLALPPLGEEPRKSAPAQPLTQPSEEMQWAPSAAPLSRPTPAPRVPSPPSAAKHSADETSRIFRPVRHSDETVALSESGAPSPPPTIWRRR